MGKENKCRNLILIRLGIYVRNSKQKGKMTIDINQKLCQQRSKNLTDQQLLGIFRQRTNMLVHLLNQLGKAKIYLG